MRYLWKVLIFWILLFIYIGCVNAQTIPTLSSAMNDKLLSESVEDVLSAIEEETNLANSVREYFDNLSKSKSQESEIKFKDLVIVLDTLPYQYSRLKSEIKRQPQSPYTNIQIKSPTNIEELKKLTLLIFKMQKYIKSQQKNIEDLEKAISVIKDNLKDSFNTYEILQKSNNTEKSLEQLVKILRLRTDYALYSIKLQKEKQLLDNLRATIKTAQDIFKNSIKSLRVTENELKDLEKEILDKENKIKTEIEDIIKQWNAIYKDVLSTELQIDTYSQKINSITKETTKTLLKVEQQRLISKLNELFVKQRGLELEKIRLNILLKEGRFWLELAEVLKSINDKKVVASYMVKWEKELEALKQLSSELDNKMQQIKDLHNEIIQKMALVSNEINNVSDITRKALKNYYYQLQIAEKEVGSHIVKGGEVRNSLDQLIFSKNTFYMFFKSDVMNVYQRVGIWSKDTLLNVWSKVKLVLFYPLFRLGNQDISLITFIKIIVILLIGIIFLRRLRIRTKEFLLQKTEMTLGTVNSITTLGYYFSLVLVVLISLSTAGMDLSQLSILLGALGVGIGFGLQTIANNFVSGLILLTDRSIKVGDFVQLDNGIVGEVMDVSIRATVIRTFDGEEVIVPNSEFVSAKVHTWTFSDDWRRLKIPFGVSYDADPELVERLAIEAAREVPSTREDVDHPLRVFFEGFGDNSLDFSIRVWCKMHDLNVRSGLISDYYFALFKKFKEAGIEIPFPQRDLHLKSISDEILEALNKYKNKEE